MRQVAGTLEEFFEVKAEDPELLLEVKMSVNSIVEESGWEYLDAMQVYLSEVTAEKETLTEEDEGWGRLDILEGYILSIMPEPMNSAELEGMIRDANALTSLDPKEVMDKTLEYYDEHSEDYIKHFEVSDLEEVIKILTA